MAEIAGDAKMSAANLYRYFDNKQELGVACAKQCIEEFFDALRAVVRRPGFSAAQCLVELARATVQWTYCHTAQQPRVNELVDMILGHRPDVVYWRDSCTCALIAEIFVARQRFSRVRY
jgi:AcrR family transcriptional regulator